MTTFYGAWRTNGFRVRDLDAFKAWVALWPTARLELAQGHAYLYDTSDDGALPTWRRTAPDAEEEIEAEFLKELGAHVSSTSVAVVQCIGFDAPRLDDVAGFACAIKGGDEPYDQRYIDLALEDIVKHAKKRFNLPVNHWNPT